MNPYRALPPRDISARIYNFFNKDKRLSPLLKTTEFASVDHFRETFTILDDGAVFILVDAIRSSIAELFKNFVSVYSSVKDKLKRITDLPLGSGFHKSFDRFEGAYRSFTNEPFVDDLFESMRSVGNVIAIAEMMDIAFALRRSSDKQNYAFLFMTPRPKDGDNNSSGDALDTRKDELFTLFDNDFKAKKSLFDSVIPAPSEKEIAPPILTNILAEMNYWVTENWDLFSEKSPTVLDFPTLTGFASTWSVLEFIYCLRDVYAKDNTQDKGSYANFGDGVMIFSSCILFLSKQVPLWRAVSIGTKIMSQRTTDIASLKEDNLDKYVRMYHLMQSSMEYALSSIDSAVTALYKRE